MKLSILLTLLPSILLSIKGVSTNFSKNERIRCCALKYTTKNATSLVTYHNLEDILKNVRIKEVVCEEHYFLKRKHEDFEISVKKLPNDNEYSIETCFHDPIKAIPF